MIQTHSPEDGAKNVNESASDPRSCLFSHMNSNRIHDVRSDAIYKVDIQ